MTSSDPVFASQPFRIAPLTVLASGGPDTPPPPAAKPAPAAAAQGNEAWAYRSLGDGSNGFEVTHKGLVRLFTAGTLDPATCEVRRLGTTHWVPAQLLYWAIESASPRAERTGWDLWTEWSGAFAWGFGAGFFACLLLMIAL